MRIVQVITPSKIAGAERVMIALCRGLAARGHAVWLVCKAGSPLIGVAAREGVNVSPMRLSGKGNVLAPFRLARFARQHGAELVGTQLSTASLWGSVAGRLLGVPVVATVQALNTKTCFLLANKIIAVSEAVRKHLLRQGVPPGRIDVVYNGVNLSRFVPPGNLSAAKREVSISPNRLVVGVVAHLTKKKGHAWFLKAAAQVYRRAPRAYFLLVGDGQERRALEEQARELSIAPEVRFAGFQPDIIPWMAAMDVVVLPSIAMEGLPRALLEAGAMEKPVIATPIGGSPEVVAHGKTGFVVPTNDIAALAEAMLQLLDDEALRRRMGCAGRRRISEHYTEEGMVVNTEKVYERLLRAHALRRSVG